MNGRTFDYRSKANRISTGFLVFCCVLWFTFTAGWIFQNRHERRSDVTGIASVYFLLGACMSWVAVQKVLGYARERIEVTNSDVSWYDWAGRLRVCAPVTEITVIVEDKNRSSIKCVVQTSKGQIVFDNTICDYGELVELFHSLKRHLAQSATNPSVNTPTVRIGTYRIRSESRIAVLVVWFAFLAYIASKNWSNPIIAVGSVLMAVVATYMVLRYLGSAINVDTEGIRSLDWRGRPVLEIKFRDIVRVCRYDSGTNPYAVVESERGSIRIDRSTVGFDDLVYDLESLAKRT